MKGEVIIPFVAQLELGSISATVGQIIEIPPNVDWVRAGFVKLLEDEAETATDAAASAVPKPGKKKAKS